MLEELRIRNFALIDEVKIDFRKGFNVLTGETGAGKSILIDALGLVLGDRGATESIRSGAKEAEVTAVFRVSQTTELHDWIRKYEIEPEDGAFIVRRTLRETGRGSITVQSVSVPRTVLEELASTLVDVHGQHEHQSLFKVATHRKLLDRFAGLENEVADFGNLFSDLTETGRALETLDGEESRMTREADFLQHAVEEIEAASLKAGEEAELEARQILLSRHEELLGHLEAVLNGAAESRGGAMIPLREAEAALKKASAIDGALVPLHERLDSTFYEMEDVMDQVRLYREQTEYEPGELENINERLSLIMNLKKKYGGKSVSDILSHAEESRARLSGFENREEERRRLTERKERLGAEVRRRAAKLSAARKAASVDIREKAERHLQALGMPDARFQVTLESRRSKEGRSVCGPHGVDDVEFLLSANRGENPKALRSVASGGELSRVMLALKTVLAESDSVPTMIFDEVDAGIGGEVARAVGEHMKALSERKQVLCVTHLASIAVFADNHLQVEKRAGHSRTATAVNPVEGERRIGEVARMLSGDSKKAVSLDHAARLLEEFGSRS